MTSRTSTTTWEQSDARPISGRMLDRHGFEHATEGDDAPCVVAALRHVEHLETTELVLAGHLAFVPQTVYPPGVPGSRIPPNPARTPATFP